MPTKTKQISEMVVFDPKEPRIISYNGVPEERELVKAEFDKLMASNMYLAYTVDKEDASKATQVKDFPEEATKIVLTPRLVGG